MSQLLKSILSTLLLIQIGLGPFAYAEEDPQAQATQIIADSHARADQLADQTFYSFLLQVINTSDPWQGVMKKLADSETNWKLKSQAILNAMDNLNAPYLSAKEAMEAQDATSDQLLAAVDEYMQNYHQALVGSRSLMHELNSGALYVEESKKTLDNMLNDIREVCDKGIDVSLESPVMPSLTFHSPRIQFEFKYSTDYGDNDRKSRTTVESPDKKDPYGLALFPITERIFGNAAPIWNAGLSYGIPIGLYFALGGKLGFLYGAAMAHSAEVASEMAALSSLGYTAILVVVLYGIEESLTRADAARAHNAVDRVFWDRATANDVRARVIQDCQGIRAKLDGVESAIHNLKQAPDSPLVKSILAQQEAAQAKHKKLVDGLVALIKKRQELNATFSGQQLEQKVQESDEKKNYDALMAQLGVDGTFEIIAASLINVGLAAEGVQDKLDQFRADTKLGAEAVAKQVQAHLSEMQERRDQILAWSRELSLRDIQSDLPELLQKESEGGKVSLAIVKSWQKSYAKIMFDYFKGETVDKASLSEIVAQAQAAESTYGKTPILEAVISRSQSLLATLDGRLK